MVRTTSLKIRELNNLPLNSIEEMNQGIFDISWCEQYDEDGLLDQILDQELNCPTGYSRITLMETFDEVRKKNSILVMLNGLGEELNSLECYQI